MDYIFDNEMKEQFEEFSIKKSIENPKVSIIIPAYNVEQYIEECLMSLIKQTLKEIEIIIIDDGSTDYTHTIACAFKEDKRVKIIKQENSGVSHARNKGIEIAQGEYISFVDSDDWVDINYFEKLYDAITRHDADIACSTMIRKRQNHQKYRVHYTKEKVYSFLQEKIDVCNVPKCCYTCSKLYKTTLVKNYRFTEGVYFEDVLWTPQILKDSYKLVTVPDTNYYYRVNNNSIVKKLPSNKKQEDSYNSKKYIVKFFDEIEDRIESDTREDDLIALHELESTLVYFATSLRANGIIFIR